MLFQLDPWDCQKFQALISSVSKQIQDKWETELSSGQHVKNAAWRRGYAAAVIDTIKAFNSEIADQLEGYQKGLDEHLAGRMEAGNKPDYKKGI